MVEKLGSEAYGFYSLGNQFISYAGIVTCALNSMAGRFITIALNQKKIDLSKRYFCSVLICNIIISVVLFIPAMFIVLFLQNLINITPEIVLDVKILWTLLFGSFFLTLIFNIYNVATFATNKIHLNSIATIFQNSIRLVILILLFTFFNPSIYYIGIATFVSTLFLVYVNYLLTRRLLPNMRIKRGLFDFKCIRLLLSSGIWNSITQLAGVLNNGLDLLICNMFISSEAMGIMSVSKTIPTYLGQMLSLFVSAFLPQLTINYAKNERREMLNNIEFCNKFMTLVVSIPLAVIVVYGKAFFSLWMPSLDAEILQLISATALSVYFIYGPVSVLNDVITITNKHKMIAITYTVAGIVNLVVVFMLLQMVNSSDIMLFGFAPDVVRMMIVAGVSSVIGVLRNAIFTPLFAAYSLHEKWYRFYPVLLKGILCVALTIIISIPLQILIPANSWLMFLISFAVSSSIAVLLCLFIMFNHGERKRLIALIIKKLKRNA